MTPRSHRPQVLPGHTIALDTNCGKLYVTVNRDPLSNRPVEVMCRFGKAGGCGSAIMDGMTRMISYGLRSGMAPEEVIRGLSGISCYHGRWSCLDALARAVAIVIRSVESGDDPNRLCADPQLVLDNGGNDAVTR